MFHSRAALLFQHTAARRRLHRAKVRPARPPGFNTQPPEGGCQNRPVHANCERQFQHTAARRRLPTAPLQDTGRGRVSTHSRPKAAAAVDVTWVLADEFQHTAARRRLRLQSAGSRRVTGFQHTAARRRLPAEKEGKAALNRFNTQPPEGGCAAPRPGAAFEGVSTHSRPKAAATVRSSS